MADPTPEVPLSGLFSFFGNDPSTGGGTNYGALEARRKIALQLLAQGGKKGYPKNIGEGLASLGDAMGEIGMMRSLQAQEAAYQKRVDTAAQEGPPGAVPPVVAPATSATPTVGPRADLTPPATREVTPVAAATPAAADIVDPSQFNEIDAQADDGKPDFTDRWSGINPSPGQQTTVAQGAPPVAAPGGILPSPAAAADFKAPAYLKDVIARNEPDPVMRQYYGQLAGKEAQTPTEVSKTGAAGPFQFVRGTGQQYGLNGPGFDKRTDPEASMKAVQALTNDNIKTLTNALGRPPTLGELALAHQQGAGTAAKMLAGTGNAPAGNLAVNNVAPGSSPGAAANKIMAYYGMPNASVPGSRDAIAAAAMQPQQPLQSADAASEGRFRDVVGMSGRDARDYSYPATASRTGDVTSDAPPLGITGAPGVSSRIGQSAGDSVQQRDQIIKTLMEQQQNQPTAPEVPPPNPTLTGAPTTGSPSMTPAAGSPDPRLAQAVNPRVVSDIRPAPAMPPESQMPPAVPPPGTPQQPIPEPPSVGRYQVPKQFTQDPQPPPAPPMTPKSPAQLYYEKMKDTVVGDPYLGQLYQNKIDREEQARAFTDTQNKTAWEAQQRQWEAAKTANQEFLRNQPQHELELRKAEDEAQQRQRDEQINRLLGGVPQADYVTMLKQGKSDIAGIPAATESIKRARALVDKMYTGPLADVDTSLAKLMGAAGFPVDPKASGTEQFKTAMAGVMAQSRKAIVGPGSQSEAELALLQKSTAADAKLTPETIKATLDAAERLNLQTALAHQKLVRRFAGETDPDRQASVYTAYGVPNMVDLVPQGAVDMLKRDAADPEAHREFDNTFHTPGLSREVLRYRR
jgi:hypothetical protein